MLAIKSISSLRFYFLLCAFAAGTSVSHANQPYIAVGTAKTKKSVIAVAPLRMGSSEPDRHGLIKTITRTLEDDLLFMDLFKLLPPESFLEAANAGLQQGEFKYTDWSSIGAEFLLKASVKPEGKTFSIDAYFYDVGAGKQILAKRYVANNDDVTTAGHTLANDIVERLTGLPGIFLTKIAMVCDRTGKKEIYVMDYDGKNTKQITSHQSIALGPAWSPDGAKIAYSLVTKDRKNVKNINLYEFDFRTNRVQQLSSKKGLNSGAAYSPDGKKIAMTMSFLGNPEIFTLDVAKKEFSRLTRSFGFDVNPSWNPSGTALTFVSSQTGKPMVYRMNTDGSGLKRLTYAGRYNDSPSWSPQNNKIAFAGWNEDSVTHKEQFDIFIMNPDGTNIERLTLNQGSNADPHFSPDGNFITFTSNRTGTRNIYVINVDGTFVRRLTFGFGNCEAPKWSAPPRASQG